MNKFECEQLCVPDCLNVSKFECEQLCVPDCLNVSNSLNHPWANGIYVRNLSLPDGGDCGNRGLPRYQQLGGNSYIWNHRLPEPDGDNAWLIIRYICIDKGDRIFSPHAKKLYAPLDVKQWHEGPRKSPAKVSPCGK